jgi:hypothetical protein
VLGIVPSCPLVTVNVSPLLAVTRTISGSVKGSPSLKIVRLNAPDDAGLGNLLPSFVVITIVVAMSDTGKVAI